MKPRDTQRPLPFWRAVRGVFDLSLEAMIWTRRSLLVGLFLGLPVLFGLLYHLVLVAQLPARISGFELYGHVVVLFFVGKALPLTALFYATALVADEIEGKTLTYLVTRPIPRVAVLAGKFLAYLGTTLSLSLPSLVLTFFLLTTARGGTGVGSAVPDLLRDLGVLALALLAYGALFTLLGVVLRRPLIPGLLFILVWELVVNLPGYLPRFTLTAWLRSLTRHRPPQEGLAGLFGGETLPTSECLLVLLAVSALCLAAAAWIFSRREYVLEQ